MRVSGRYFCRLLVYFRGNFIAYSGLCRKFIFDDEKDEILTQKFLCRDFLL